MLLTNIWIYPYPKSWHKRISKYIHIQKMIRMNIRKNIQIKNIWIFEYPCHTLLCLKMIYYPEVIVLPSKWEFFCRGLLKALPWWCCLIMCGIHDFSILLGNFCWSWIVGKKLRKYVKRPVLTYKISTGWSSVKGGGGYHLGEGSEKKTWKGMVFCQTPLEPPTFFRKKTFNPNFF